MAHQTINIGNIANDGTGDELRVAFRKINDNFEDIDLRVGDPVDGINTGGGAGVFVQRVNNDLEFRSITGGTNITVTEDANTIAISVDSVLTTSTDAGSVTLSPTDELKIFGGTDIETRFESSNNSIVIDNTKVTELADDTSPVLSGSLDANLNNINNVNNITANTFTGGSFFGTLFGSIANASTADITKFFGDLDLGTINPSVVNFYDAITLFVTIDYGTFVTPTATNSNFGSLV